MSYTTSDLLTRFRLDVDDEATPYLWDDEEFYDYLTEAQLDFCRETRSLRDSTHAMCTITLVADQAEYDIDSRILEVVKAVRDNGSRPMTIMNFNELEHNAFSDNQYDYLQPIDWTQASGEPTTLVLDATSNQVRMAPIPTATGTVSLWVIRDPLKDIKRSVNLEVQDVYDQITLLHYVKYLAYTKQDSDVLDPTRADTHYKQYLGRTEKARQRLLRKQRRPGAVRYGGL